MSQVRPSHTPEPFAATLTLRNDPSQHGGESPSKRVINRNIYGHFAEHLGRCIYEGVWVGEGSSIANTRGIRKDVVSALRALDIPVLRWPGGCFADEYHWRDGIGPREARPKMINTHWGGVVEDNHFGTHEFLDLCEQTGAEPYICGNVGSGTVQEMANWVEYITSDADSPLANLRRKHGRQAPWRLRYFGVGNESWGCGGHMRPDYYADNYRRYATYVRNYSGNVVERFACGPNGDDYAWTEELMKAAAAHMQGLSLHWYTVPSGDWNRKGSATEFEEGAWHSTFERTLRMDELIAKHSAIMDRYDPAQRVGLVVDEWGTWYDAQPGTNPGFLYQQNTLRDALVAGLNFNIFNRHCDRVVMTNIAQTINVLQALMLTDQERLLLTPTYHAFEMYRVHQGATLIPLDLATPEYRLDERSIPALHGSASRNASGRIHLSLVNLDPNRPATLVASPISAALSARVLTAPTINAHNTFEDPHAVEPQAFDDFNLVGNSLAVNLPAKSLVVLELSDSATTIVPLD